METVPQQPVHHFSVTVNVPFDAAVCRKKDGQLARMVGVVVGHVNVLWHAPDQLHARMDDAEADVCDKNRDAGYSKHERGAAFPAEHSRGACTRPEDDDVQRGGTRLHQSKITNSFFFCVFLQRRDRRPRG